MSKFDDAFESTAGFVTAIAAASIVSRVAAQCWNRIKENFAEANRLRAENPNLFDESFLRQIRHLPYADAQGEQILKSIYLLPEDVRRIREKWHIESGLASWRASAAASPNKVTERRPPVMRVASKSTRPRALLPVPQKQLAAPIEVPAVEPLKKQRGGRAKETINKDTLQKLSIYIGFRDAGAADKTARIKTVQALHPTPISVKRTRAALDRAIKRRLNNGDYSKQQARKFRNI
ncbi:MAG: hypothetical protein ACR2LC_16990 [Pyrinomonadaceae bacterium]